MARIGAGGFSLASVGQLRFGFVLRSVLTWLLCGVARIICWGSDHPRDFAVGHGDTLKKPLKCLHGTNRGIPPGPTWTLRRVIRTSTFLSLVSSNALYLTLFQVTRIMHPHVSWVARGGSMKVHAGTLR